MTRVVAALASLALIFWVPQTAKTDLDRLQGTWVVTDATGMQLPAGALKALVVTGDKYEGQTNGKPDERGTIKINSATKPWSIDLLVAEAPGVTGTQLGLVDIAGDTMTIALSDTGAPTRPADFSGEKIIATRLLPIAKTFEGEWTGAVGDAGQTLRLTVRLANGPNGLASGTLVSVDQGGREAPIGAVVQMGAKLRLVLPVIRATYDGELKGGELVGTWRQGRESTALTMKRVK